MTYLIIDVAGAMEIRSEPATLRELERALGPEGGAHIYLDREPGVVAWINDNAYSIPERCPRNPIGSGVLASMGAVRRAYAGPLVLTAFDYTEGGLLPHLDGKQRVYINAVLECVTAVSLGGPSAPRPRDDAPEAWGDWAAVMALYLEFVVSYPDPVSMFDATLLGRRPR